MVCPQATGGGDSLQIWRVAVHILNKQSWTSQKGWSYSLGAGFRANNSRHKKSAHYEMLHRRGRKWQ